MKVFKEYRWFDFKPVTLLTGTNNSGKSSIINAMQMLQENIKANNLDELIKTEFRLIANQKKYGSIESFINNQSKDKNKYFVYSRRIGNIEYSIKVNAVKGLESYGSIKTIKAIDHKIKDQVFILDVKSPYPDYKCVFNINYKYFVDRFYEKCRNTEKLRQRIVELDDLIKLVNNGKVQIQEVEKLVHDISQEFSIYIVVSDEEVYSIGLSNTLVPSTDKYHYLILNEEMASVHGLPKIDDEPRVLWKTHKGEKGLKWSGFITENEYNKSYASACKNGIFDFKELWETNHDLKADFERLISSFYKESYSKSYKMLCDDLLTMLSHTSWEMQERYSNEFDPSFVPECLTKTYINSLPDFGLIASGLKYKKENQVNKNIVADRFIEALANLSKDNTAFKKFENSGFYKDIYAKLNEILFEKYKEDDLNFTKRNQIISEPVFNVIYADIFQKIINVNLEFDNIYISSNRFMTKRTYSFNDNTDFTNLLKQIERLESKTRMACNEFINKWIKEFDIADELILRSDSESGNFKAYLKSGKTETLLADLGLGTNQLLPIIFSLGIHSYFTTNYSDELLPRTVVIEEPEANLHPALQSKLADMFVDANKKFNVQIIAETHSEYLVRKLQYLTANGEFSPEDTVIYYFNKPTQIPQGEEQVKRIEIQEDGSLSSDFGPGFFDESLNWKFELMKLKNQN